MNIIVIHILVIVEQKLKMMYTCSCERVKECRAIEVLGKEGAFGYEDIEKDYSRINNCFNDVE